MLEHLGMEAAKNYQRTTTTTCPAGSNDKVECWGVALAPVGLMYTQATPRVSCLSDQPGSRFSRVLDISPPGICSCIHPAHTIHGGTQQLIAKQYLNLISDWIQLSSRSQSRPHQPTISALTISYGSLVSREFTRSHSVSCSGRSKL